MEHTLFQAKGVFPKTSGTYAALIGKTTRFLNNKEPDVGFFVTKRKLSTKSLKSCKMGVMLDE